MEYRRELNDDRHRRPRLERVIGRHRDDRPVDAPRPRCRRRLAPPRREGRAAHRRRHLDPPRDPRDRPADHDGVRRPDRRARHRRRRTALGAAPRAVGDRRHVGRRAAGPPRHADGRRGPTQGRRRDPRARGQPAAQPGGRPTLRVPLGGPVPHRAPRGRVRRGHPGAGHRRLRQALRRQRDRDRPHRVPLAHRRAHAPRGLPRAVRGRRRRGRVDHHGRLQRPHPRRRRRDRHRARPAAERDPQGRVGLRRHRDQRLAGHEDRGRAGARRPRPRDARPRRPVGRGTPRRGARRSRARGGHRRQGRAHRAPRRARRRPQRPRRRDAPLRRERRHRGPRR